MQLIVDQAEKAYKEIGERLEEFRMHCGVSRKEFAKHIGISVPYYNNIAIGSKLISSKSLIQLIKYSNETNASWILTGIGNMIAILKEEEEIDKEIEKLKIENALLKELLGKK